MDEENVGLVVECTNLKAVQWIADQGTDYINGVHWKPCTVDEMYVFLALNMKMGITHEPR